MGEVRDRMVAGAVRLLAQKGLQAASFSEILELTQAPRGSVYHHFPGGKDQLVAEAVDLAGSHALAALERPGSSAREIAGGFIGLWRELLVRSNFGAGCAVVAVTVAADSTDLLDKAAAVFQSWREKLALRLTEGGLSERAEDLAALLISSTEGAVVLSRAARSLEPFDTVAGVLMSLFPETR
jgi:AcrR family transcriptional regulator